MPCLLFVLASLPAPPLQDPVGPSWSDRIEWSAGSGPPAREHAALVLDPQGTRAVLLAGSGYAPYGSPLGDAWALDLADDSWSELELVGDELPPGGTRRAGCFEAGAFLHGGYGAGFAALDGLWSVEFADGQVAVERIAQESPPPARLLHAFACDASGERFAVFGGGSTEREFGDTWLGQRTDDGVRWTELEDDFNPGPRLGFAFAYDPREERLLVCGGQVPPQSPDDARFIGARDLWALDFRSDSPSWTLLAEYGADELPGRRNPAFTFDQESGDLLIWGGTGDGRTALPNLYVVRTRLEGAPVERIDQPAGITHRASGFGVVDRARQRALLGFGNTAQGPLEDLAEVRLRTPARGGGH